MQAIDKIYIDGEFVTPHGEEYADLFNPSTEERIGRVRLGDETDIRAAILAAKRAFPLVSNAPPAERAEWLRRLRRAVAANIDGYVEALRKEYGAPGPFADWASDHALAVFENMANLVETYEFHRRVGASDVTMKPLGVVGAITPWNMSSGFIASKLAAALAAGCSIVFKPSEMSAIQTQFMAEALHEADLPPGAFNIVNGAGPVAGAELSRHPDVAKITFTGSTASGRAILEAAAPTFKRVTLELGGKGPQIILMDADIDAAVRSVIANGMNNSGQSCTAGTRVLVPAARVDDVLAQLKAAVEAVKVGPPEDGQAQIGPLVSRKQWDRVQSYIRLGQEEGATLLTGGEGRPEGLESGWFVRPTVFAGVTNQMRIAREEIFGPVLSVIAYRDEAEAIEIANDTDYGLQSYVLSADAERARRVASRLEAGRVVINDAGFDDLAPFGGFKQSGIGREYGIFGLEAFLEPSAVIS